MTIKKEFIVKIEFDEQFDIDENTISQELEDLNVITIDVESEA